MIVFHKRRRKNSKKTKGHRQVCPPRRAHRQILLNWMYSAAQVRLRVKLLQLMMIIV